jgi:hypothetical protein
MLKSFYFFFLLMLTSNLTAQDIEIPYNIIESVKNNSRTLDGTPGKNYFQNHTNYIINAKINPSNGLLKGKADITYFNNSHDTLTNIVMRLYQNIFKPTAIRDEEIEPVNINSGIIITDLRLNGIDFSKNLNSHTRTDGTNFVIYLLKGLNPSDSCKILIEWNYKLPQTPVHRFGKYDESTSFVAYWYPQVAVYDDIDGWDEEQYNGTQEFYNDFNSYDIRLTMPSEIMLWATGEWVNPQEILKPEIAGRFHNAKNSDKVIHIINQEDIDNKSVLLGGSHTFHFFADNVPDFVFAFSGHYLWDATSVVVDSGNMRKVIVSSVYPEDSKDFKIVDSLGSEIVRQLSFESYRVPFPYPNITIFNGDDGMEFPMMVNNGSMNYVSATIYLTLHEIAHAYFPFMTGINERKYSWVDEGLTSFLPFETQTRMKSDFYSLEFWVNKYNMYCGTEIDVPLQVPAYQTRDYSYQFYSYNKPVIGFYMLQKLIGRDTFRLAIKNFINIWENKHPTPYDLLNVIEKTSNQEIGWFVNQWFFQSGYPDLTIKGAKINDDSVYVQILKKGKFPVPVDLKFIYDNGDEDSVKMNLKIWKGKDNLEIVQRLRGKLVKIELGNSKIPDKNNNDNYFKF